MGNHKSLSQPVFRSPLFRLSLCRCTCLALRWVDSWLRNLLKSRINLPEFTLWSCATPLVTHRSSTRHGLQTGRLVLITFPVVMSLFLWTFSHKHCCFSSFWLMPAFMLKKIVLGNFAKGPVDPKMADAIDFMVDRVSTSTIPAVFKALML